MSEMYLATSFHAHWTEKRIVFLQSTVENYSIKGDAKSILPYSEPGEMGPVIWFDVLMKDGRKIRVNGAHIISVEYEDVPIEYGELDSNVN